MEKVQDIWAWLEKEYGGQVELTSALIRRLQEFTFNKTSRMDTAKFIDLHTTWMEVYNHLKAVG